MGGAGNSKWSAGCGGLILGAFVVIWLGLTGTFTAIIYGGYAEVLRVRSSYQPVQGVIERAEINRQHGSRGGSSYVADVSYRYVIGETTYRGDRFSVWEDWSEHSSLKKRLERYPTGAAVTVWVHPTEPMRSVLDPHAENFQYLLFIFLVPFQMIAAVIVYGLFGMVRSAMIGRERSLAREYFEFDRPDRFVVRVGDRAPLMYALYGFGMTCFFAIFVIAITMGSNCPAWTVPAVFLVGLVVGGYLELRDRRRNPAKKNRFVLDRLTGRFWLRTFEGHTAEVAEVCVVSRTRRNSDGEPEKRFDVVLRMVTGKDRKLIEGVESNDDAEILGAMIRERLHGSADSTPVPTNRTITE